MAALHRLNNKKIKSLTAGKYCDGGGLWFHKRKEGGAQWAFRYTIYGKRREIGLGGFPKLGLAEAREQAKHWRDTVASGKDPQKERERIAREYEKGNPTVATLASETFEARKRQLVGDGKAGRWESPLRLHVLPKIGKMPIAEVDQRDIQRALAPIWHNKAETARKALSRLNLVFKHAAAAGIDVDTQATEKAKALLGAQGDTKRHIPAMDWQDVPNFYQSLEGTLTELALRLLILTALRSTPIRNLHLDHIQGDILTVPPELMKGTRGKKVEFRVPLSKEALQVIEQAKQFERGGYLFPSVRKGVISDATMTRYMDRKGLQARPHGFRSSFRTWVAESTNTPLEVAETALAHVSGSKVELAYRRTDYIDQRRVLMERWADHVTAKQDKKVLAFK